SGLVTHVPYGAVELTAEGRSLALRMLRRHRLIETWLVQCFGYSWDEVHVEAEVLEHALSDRLLESISEQLGHPVRDPHGDPIPAADGRVLQPDAVLLRDAPEGTECRVVRISDRDPQLLRHLDAESITVDAAISVLGRTPPGGEVLVRVAGRDRELDPQAAASIWVAVNS
ncbi:MAG: metal-dependent transcriptional regulator, partial [Lacisediminihabitans sp.]